jgi:hypothetical protein
LVNLITNAAGRCGTDRHSLAQNLEFRLADQHSSVREQTTKYGGDQITKPLLYH